MNELWVAVIVGAFTLTAAILPSWISERQSSKRRKAELLDERRLKAYFSLVERIGSIQGDLLRTEIDSQQEVLASPEVRIYIKQEIVDSYFAFLNKVWDVQQELFRIQATEQYQLLSDKNCSVRAILGEDLHNRYIQAISAGEKIIAEIRIEVNRLS